MALQSLAEVSNAGPGPKTIAVYLVGKRDSYVIVARLSPEFTGRLVDRWTVGGERIPAGCAVNKESTHLTMHCG